MAAMKTTNSDCAEYVDILKVSAQIGNSTATCGDTMALPVA